MAKRASSDGAMGVLATAPSCIASRNCVSIRVDATSESEDVDSDDQVRGGVNAMWGEAFRSKLSAVCSRHRVEQSQR